MVALAKIAGYLAWTDRVKQKVRVFPNKNPDGDHLRPDVSFAARFPENAAPSAAPRLSESPSPCLPERENSPVVCSTVRIFVPPTRVGEL